MDYIHSMEFYTIYGLNNIYGIIYNLQNYVLSLKLYTIYRLYYIFGIIYDLWII
jgi:hypothetical protein